MTATRLEYDRPRDASDVEALMRVMTEAFGPRDPDNLLFSRHHGPDRMRVVRAADEIVSGVMLLPLAHWFGGRTVRAVGYNGVATLPEHRGDGAGRRLVEESLREMRREGVALASLYSSNDRFYERAGFATAGTMARRRLPIDRLPRVRSALRAVRVDGERAAVETALAPLADRRGRVSSGLVRRPPMLWERLLTEHAGTTVFRLQRDPEDASTAEGFVIVAYAGMFAKVVALDLCLLSDAAVHGAIALLGGYGSNPEALEYCVLPGDPLLDAVSLPNAEFVFHEQWLLRIVDVAAAITERGYLASSGIAVEIEVADEVIPDNAGRWRVDLEDGRATVSRGGAGRVRIDVGTLAKIYSGRVLAFDPALRGRIDGPDRDLAALARLFAGPEPYSLDFY